MTNHIDRNKYTVHICKCGHIHFINNDEIDAAIYQNKCYVNICEKCGEWFVIGANHVDAWITDDGEEIEPESYDMWSDVINHGSFTSFEIYHTPIYKIQFSSGKAVLMNNGQYANHYYDNSFWSDQSMFNYSHEIDEYFGLGQSVETIEKDVRDFHENSMKVDMTGLIATLTEEECYNLSKYAYRCFDWSGTKYEIN